MQSLQKHEGGFTLLELLMVVFVVGIMAGLTVMSIGGNAERQLRRDVARLQQVMVMAQDEAPYAGEEIGFWLDDNGKTYRFFAFDQDKLEWRAYDKEGFTQHKLPADCRFELEVDGDPVDLAKLYKKAYKLDDQLDNVGLNDKKDADKQTPVPWLVFFSDGHYTPFRLWIGSPSVKDSVFALEGDGLGDIRVREVPAREKPDVKHD